jgi:hypothetical protein
MTWEIETNIVGGSPLPDPAPSPSAGGPSTRAGSPVGAGRVCQGGYPQRTNPAVRIPVTTNFLYV